MGWVLAPAVFLIGLMYYGGTLTPLSIFQLILLSIPFSLLLYGINGIYDYESDQINPRKQLVAEPALEPQYHRLIKKCAIIVAGVLIISSAMTLNLGNIIGIILLLFFAFQYSAPPLRLKEKPLLDSISNGIIYFLAPFLLGASFVTSILAFPPHVYILTFCVMGIHSFSTIMDYSADQEVGDRTFAVVLGKRAAALFTLIIFVIAALVPGFQHPPVYQYFILCIILSFTITLYPSEKLATIFFYTIGTAFIIVAILMVYIYLQWFGLTLF